MRQSRFDHVCLQLDKTSRRELQRWVKILNYPLGKVKGFDSFSLKKRDLITVFMYIKGFYPGSRESMRLACSQSTLSKKGRPSVWQGDILDIKDHTTQTSYRMSFWEVFNWGKGGEEEKDRKWTKWWQGLNSRESNLIAPARHRYCSINCLCHLALFLYLLNMPCPRFRNLPSDGFPEYPSCCSFRRTGLNLCLRSPRPLVFIEHHLYERVLYLGTGLM